MSEKPKRKTKLEKICELESNLKVLREENRRLKKRIHVSQVDVSANRNQTSEERLKEALRSLKKVTVKQEMSLVSLRSKSKQRRAEIEERDRIIQTLKTEVDLLKGIDNVEVAEEEDEAAFLRARLADLKVKLAEEAAGRMEQGQKLKMSNDNVNSLQGQLNRLKGNVRAPSSRSLRSGDSSASGLEDVAKLKKELARKISKIASLEFDLELARDEIHDLKQQLNVGHSFPAIAAPAPDDFLSDDEEEDDFWNGDSGFF